MKEHLYYSMKRMRRSIEVDYKDYFEEENEEGRNGEDDEKHEGDDAAGISWSLNDLMRQSY